jgi:Ca2+-binding EF-hand superfamily protein
MDGNGSIDSYEFTCALAMLSHATLDVISKSYLQEKAELIFNLYDFDGSKFISQDELVILMTNVLSSLNAMKGLKAPSIEEVERKTIETMKKMDTN